MSLRQEGNSQNVFNAQSNNLADAPLPYTFKPARQSQRRRAKVGVRQDTEPSSPIVASNRELSTMSGQHMQADTAELRVHPYHSASRTNQPQMRDGYSPPSDAARGQTTFQSQTNLAHGNRFSTSRDPAYGRPLPQHQQLYNPYVGLPQTYQQPWFRRPGLNQYTAPQAIVQTQVAYLDALAGEEVPKAMVSREEEQQKETMRAVLEDICQRVITEYEVEKDSLFDGTSISLKCYGSLRTGFATQSSDMDLALQSPLSKPEVSSIESAIPRLLEKAFLDHGYGARLLTRTRIPLIRFCEKPTPELTELLHKERQKWEKEKDALPKTRETRKAAEEKGNRFESSNKIEENHEGDSTHHDGILDSSITPHIEVHGSEKVYEASTSELPASISAGTEAAIPGLKSPRIQANDTSDARENRLDSNPINLHKLSLRDNKDQEEQSNMEKPPHSSSKERRETVLPDAELVRLYKLAIKEGWFEPHERKVIWAFCEAIARNKPADIISECRTKLLSLPDVLNRYRPPPEHQLDYPTDGVGVQCDIIFSDPLAVHNSAMLRCYNLSDLRVKPMVVFIKAWAKRRKINSPYHGTLSSYGYVLMVLHYLVNVAQPPICLNLQTTDMAMRDRTAENMQVIEGYGVRFWRNEAEIQQWARSGRITSDRHSTIGSLLRGFFRYFAVPIGGFSWATDVLSLRTPGGILSKTEKGWTAAKTEILDSAVEGQRGQEVRQRYLFAIEDPFETNHNIARTIVHNGIVAIRDEFRRANRLIDDAGNGKITEKLFAEADSKNDLNYRHFGPRPRPPPSK